MSLSSFVSSTWIGVKAGKVRGLSLDLKRKGGCVCALGSSSSSEEISRRNLIFGGVGSVIGVVLGGAGGSDHALAEPVSGQSVVNGVLSAYGLPNIPDKNGFIPVLEEFGKDKIVEFLYPSAWLLVKEQAGIDRPRLDLERVVPTISVGDYRKAEGLAFYSTSADGKQLFDVPATKLAKLAITAPNPDFKVLKDTKLERTGYRLTTFAFETNTPSGFNAQRRAFAVSTVVDDTLFLLGGACNELRYKQFEPLAMTSFDNFKITKLNRKN